MNKFEKNNLQLRKLVSEMIDEFQAHNWLTEDTNLNEQMKTRLWQRCTAIIEHLDAEWCKRFIDSTICVDPDEVHLRCDE